MGSMQEGVSGLAYVVDYGENLWMGLPTETQRFAVDQWLKKAQALECKTLVVRLHPDDFFPMYGNEKPYIVAQYPVESTAPPLMRTKTKCFIELTDAWRKLPEGEALAARQEAREYGKRSGCDAWEVWSNNLKLDSGANTQQGQHGVGRG